MKGTELGEFQELVLLSVGVMNGDAYGVNIMDQILEKTKRKVTVSTIHTALYRLEQKAFVKSYFGGESNKRGGRKKRLYQITAIGYQALSEAKSQREKFWNLLPDFSFNHA
jgi:DNA-binding PadR family transcriptional regulator